MLDFRIILKEIIKIKTFLLSCPIYINYIQNKKPVQKECRELDKVIVLIEYVRMNLEYLVLHDTL